MGLYFPSWGFFYSTFYRFYGSFIRLLFFKIKFKLKSQWKYFYCLRNLCKYTELEQEEKNMTTDLQLNKYLRKCLKLAVGHTQGRTELARLKSFSSWQGVATCSVLDCDLEKLKVRNVFRLGGCWCWGVLLGGVCTSYWLYFGKFLAFSSAGPESSAGTKQKIDLLSYSFLRFMTTLFELHYLLLLLHPRDLLPPHPHLSVLQCSLALFLWKFVEFTSFHSFSVFLFFLLKLAT